VEDKGEQHGEETWTVGAGGWRRVSGGAYW